MKKKMNLTPLERLRIAQWLRKHGGHTTRTAERADGVYYICGTCRTEKRVVKF